MLSNPTVLYYSIFKLLTNKDQIQLKAISNLNFVLKVLIQQISFRIPLESRNIAIPLFKVVYRSVEDFNLGPSNIREED